jgi:hypothetical protein
LGEDHSAGNSTSCGREASCQLTALIAVQDLKGKHDDTNARNMTPAIIVLCHYHWGSSSWGSSLHHSSSPVSTIMPFGEVRDQMSL